MRKILVVVAVALVASFAEAAHDYPITLKVDKAENIEAQHGSLSFGWLHGSGGGSYGHRVIKHILAIGSDNNVYDMIPKDQRDLILPGTYPARLEKRDIVLQIPKNDKGGTREVKLNVVEVEPVKP